MPVMSATTDAAARSMTFVAELDAPVERVWLLWADPRQLERWWGPPGYPAVITEFSFAPGGRMLYRMVGDEDGERLDGVLTFLTIDEPTALTYEDAFIPADAPGEGLPTNRSVVGLEPLARGTRMTIEVTFLTESDYDDAVAYGAFEGYEAALGQLDEILTQKGHDS